MAVNESCFTNFGGVDNIDIFEAVTFSGGQWFILFLDLYHPKKSRIAPDGFQLSPKACQFSGFHHFCADFPYDFDEMKRREGLGPAYMPTGNILHGIKSRAYERPMDHMAQLEHLGVVKSRSTPVENTAPPPVPRDYQSLVERAVSTLATNTRRSLGKRCITTFERHYFPKCANALLGRQIQKYSVSSARLQRLSTG